VNILAVTSHVVYGHVGGQAAILALQRAGHEVWHLPTVVFSNHPGHGGFAGEATAPELVQRLIDGLAARGFLDRVDAVLSGYLGSAGSAEILAATVASLKAQRPLTYCCDPVLGDDGRHYVAAGIEEVMRERLLPLADLLTPNRYELARLSGVAEGGLEEAVAAAEHLRARGAGSVLAKSAAVTRERISNAVVGPKGGFAVALERLVDVPYGTGDLLAALMLAARLAGLGDGAALAQASAQVAGVIAASVASGADELALVAAQEVLATPPAPLAVRRLA
jgi:pyridoxine kinase